MNMPERGSKQAFACWCVSSPHLCLFHFLCLFTDGSSLAPGKNTSSETALNPNSGLTDPSPPIQRRLLLMHSYVWKHVCDNFFGNLSFWNIQVAPELSQTLGELWTPQGVVIWWVSLSPLGDTKGARDRLDAPTPKVAAMCKRLPLSLPFPYREWRRGT